MGNKLFKDITICHSKLLNIMFFVNSGLEIKVGAMRIQETERDVSQYLLMRPMGFAIRLRVEI